MGDGNKTKKKPRLLPPGQVLDVASTASFLGVTEKAVRARVARRLIPFRKWGGRVIFLRQELTAFLENLPGCELNDALQNEAVRRGEDKRGA